MELAANDMKNIVIFGKDGMTGSDLEFVLKDKYNLYSFGSTWDISDEDRIAPLLEELKPDIIINAAAYNFVDQAEVDKKQAYRSNALGPKCLAELSSKHGSKLIHFSTNFVFDGKKGTPYFENDSPSPLSFYGYSKLCGDQFIKNVSNNHLIIRTSWIFGNNGNDFIKWAFSNKDKDTLSIVDDQYANPTYSKDLAKFVDWSIKQNLSGTSNFTNTGVCSKYELISHCFKVAGVKSEVKPAKSEEFNSLAIRPKNGALSSAFVEGVQGYKIPEWQDAVSRYIRNDLSY